MNIKGFSQIISINSLRKTERKSTQANADRDPSSQQEQGKEERKHKITSEEIEEAIKYLKNLDGIKGNNLQVRLSQENGITLVFVEDIKGKVIRRIPEAELLALTQNQSKTKGQLLDKSY